MLDTKARVLLALGREGDALQAFEQSNALSPDPAVAAEIQKLEAKGVRASGGASPSGTR
jgi:hypothetical protein